MKKEQLQELIEQGLSQHKIAKILNVSQATIQRYLKQFNLKTKSMDFNIYRNNPYLCEQCGETNKAEFPPLRKSLCKKCHQKYMSNLRLERKKILVDYKGGKCQICGYNKYYGALDFHHLDPNTKDPDWIKLRQRKLEKIKEELDKCILLCSNCHKEVHANLTVLP